MNRARLSLAGLVMLLLLMATLAAVSAPISSQSRLADKPGLRWFKGNTHTHTVNSDGDSTPDEVVRWYREHGYNFLVLSDHNVLTSVDGLNALHAADGKFLVIKGEEISDAFAGKPIHVNGLNLTRLVDPQHGQSVADTIQRNVDAVRAAKGVPHINHPNFEWAITADDLKQVQNNKLFEIYNGHFQVNNLGGGGMPGLEEVWDTILTSGKLLFGIAVDDAHHFKQPWNMNSARPGQGWVVVRAARLNAEVLLEAMERGDFYASTGVELIDYQADTKGISISIKPQGVSRYRTQFVGDGGRVLKEDITLYPAYQFNGNETYVRAKVIDSNGKVAWTQPVWRKQ